MRNHLEGSFSTLWDFENVFGKTIGIHSSGIAHIVKIYMWGSKIVLRKVGWLDLVKFYFSILAEYVIFDSQKKWFTLNSFPVISDSLI